MTKMLYEGKAKKIFEVPGVANQVLVEYKDSLTAFNALKKGSFENKGEINRNIASLLFRYLNKHGIKSHWIADQGNYSMLVKRVAIIPLEVVIRNSLAGSTAKKLGIEEGKKLAKPLVEFYFKNDELQDPFLSDDQALMMGIVTETEIKELKAQALQINSGLKNLFLNLGIDLIDFKIEFGKDDQGNIILADEISPDCCRLWDLKSGEKLDKDRFRRDLGNVKESYQEVYSRLERYLAGELGEKSKERL
jgi:phosphoribosylaminoimidazole-succinocarboxamide synthase